jgi:hypothetical protein
MRLPREAPRAKADAVVDVAARRGFAGVARRGRATPACDQKEERRLIAQPPSIIAGAGSSRRARRGQELVDLDPQLAAFLRQRLAEASTWIEAESVYQRRC